MSPKKAPDWDPEPHAKKLMLQFYACDISATSELEKWWRRPLCDYFRLKVHGIRETSEDLAQETLLRMVRTKTGGTRFDEAKPFSNWMYGIARNVLNDALRDQYVVHESEEPEAERTSGQQGRETGSGSDKGLSKNHEEPQREYIRSEVPESEIGPKGEDPPKTTHEKIDEVIGRRLAVRGCLEQLSEMERTVAISHFLERRKLTEIAKQVGHSVGWVHGVKERAKQKVEKCLRAKGFQ